MPHTIRDALLVYHFLGTKSPNPQDVLAFTRSLYDEKTGLYAEKEGGAGSIRGTAAALQIFTLLGTIKAPFVTNNFEKINEVLREALVEADQEAFFTFGSSTDSAVKKKLEFFSFYFYVYFFPPRLQTTTMLSPLDMLPNLSLETWNPLQTTLSLSRNPQEDSAQEGMPTTRAPSRQSLPSLFSLPFPSRTLQAK